MLKMETQSTEKCSGKRKELHRGEKRQTCAEVRGQVAAEGRGERKKKAMVGRFERPFVATTDHQRRTITGEATPSLLQLQRGSVMAAKASGAGEGGLWELTSLPQRHTYTADLVCHGKQHATALGAYRLAEGAGIYRKQARR